MRKRIWFALTLAASLAAVVAVPWLAWAEAQRQAWEAEAEITLGYAQDVLHRADETARQVQAGIARLVRADLPPCSDAALQLMRQIDLTSTYIQAIGHVRADGTLACSSMGNAGMPLGPVTTLTPRGVDMYLRVPTGDGGHALMGVAHHGYVALVHRDLPLDIWAGTADVSLAVLYLDRPRALPPELARGDVDQRWIERLGTRASVTFTDGRHLVAVVRSRHFPIVAVAAVPVARLASRTRAIERRLLPAGAVAGLLLGAAVLFLGRQQMSLAAALRQALRRDEFFLDYQPIVDLATGRWVGAEALLRWRRPHGELIGPDLFIPVAEQGGMMQRLTQRVLQLVERDAGAWLARHPDFHVAINLAPADLRSQAIVPLVDGFLRRTGAAPANLIVEITERGFLDLDSACRTIAALRARGIGVAIDDFGTGYSSLSYLASLDLDFLKIDRSFVEAIGTGAPTSQVVEHIMSLARSMGLRMIAEGVERPAQAAFLGRHGVQCAQGWLYGRPMPFARIADALAQQRAEEAAPASP